MPELPEVETTLRGIQPFIDQAELTSVTVRNAALRWPVPVDEINQLTGQRVEQVSRRAKYILIRMQTGSLMLHLGMSGSVRVLAEHDLPEPLKHDHIDLRFKNSETQTHLLRYHDPRRFGSLLFVEHDQPHPLLVGLGPEPLTPDFTGKRLFDLSRNRTIAVKNFIMTNQVVVGVGNIYASEALFLAGIRPTRQAGKVSQKAYNKLSEAIKHVLEKAIAVGGTTLRDFTRSDGKAGYFRQQLNVYEREGQNCYKCNALIKRVVIGQRSSFYCSSCQR